MSVVRGELVDAVTGEPAAHALLRVDIAGQAHYYGLADEAGRFAVAFPPPPLVGGLAPLWASPGGAVAPSGPAVTDRSWDLTLTVSWQPDLHDPLPGTVLPDYGRLLHQAPAELVLSESSPFSSALDWPGTLDYGSDLVAATAGHRQLLVASQGSPP